MKRALLLFLGLSAHAFGAGLDRYAQLVPKPRDSTATSRAGVRVTYLGTNGFQFESKGRALLVDPYFSRVNLWRVAFGLQIEPDLVRIDQAMEHLAPNPDAILVTHGHFDHLLDVPIVMSKTNARLIATAAAGNLVRRAGVPSRDAVTAGDVRQIGPWKIRILSAAHDRLFGKVPFNGRERPGIRPPQRAADWICGEPLAFLIEIDGQRIFIDSGGTPAILPPADIGPVDLAILGAALTDSRARFPAAVRQLRPRYVFPSHQDNFFRPLSAGFQFGPLTNFPGLLRDYRSQALPGQLILFDYFRPWTLPAAAIPKSQGSNPNQTIKSQR